MLRRHIAAIPRLLSGLGVDRPRPLGATANISRCDFQKWCAHRVTAVPVLKRTRHCIARMSRYAAKADIKWSQLFLGDDSELGERQLILTAAMECGFSAMVRRGFNEWRQPKLLHHSGVTL